MNNKKNGLILHDYFAMMGGGERLVVTLADSLGWPIRAGFVEKQLFQEGQHRAIPASLNAYSGIAPLRILSLIQKWQNFHAEPTDNMVYSGVYAPLALANHQANQVLYCHTPPRFVYDKKEYYLNTIPSWQRYLMRFLIDYFQQKYATAVRGMDRIIANSHHIQKRIKTHLDLPSEVVYPPCDTHHFHWQSQGDYYLSTARLDGLKRVEHVVQAFLHMPDKKLLVASGGSELKRLQLMAQDSPNIVFTGWISQPRLYELVNNCIATIYIPRDEDFGISPVESMAAGKPVIGVNEGGLKETIIDGETGYLLDGQRELSLQLQSCVKQLSPHLAKEMRENCEKQAQNFSQEIFLAAMREHLV